jgi:hypothetical protein
MHVSDHFDQPRGHILEVALQIRLLVRTVRLGLERARVQTIRIRYGLVEHVGSGALGALLFVLLGFTRRQRLKAFINLFVLLID